MPTVSTTPFGRVYTRDRSAKLWIRFKEADGREVRKSAGTADIAEAERILEEEYQAARELTFREAVVDFFETHARNLRHHTQVNYRVNLKTVDPYFGRRSLGRITVNDLKVFMAARRRQVSDTTVKRELMFVSSVYTHAMTNMVGGPEFNPVLALPRNRLKENKRTRWLTAFEYQRLLEACRNDMHRSIIEVAAHTGMRSGELKALRKSMIDWKRAEIHLPGWLNKNNRPRVIPLNGHALRTLETVCETAPEDLVFWHSTPALPYQQFQPYFRKARAAAGLEDVRFHDLRHTFASWWVQQGGSIFALKEILGHSSLAMVQRYAHLDTASAHREMQRTFPHTFSTVGKI